MTDRGGLCSSRASHCAWPRFWKRRFRHRPWICDCGRAWTVRWVGAADSGYWQWEQWPRV